MRRIVALVFLLAMCLALPVAAGVGNNPNADSIPTSPVRTAPIVPLVIATGPAGHQPTGSWRSSQVNVCLGRTNGNVLFPSSMGPASAWSTTHDVVLVVRSD